MKLVTKNSINHSERGIKRKNDEVQKVRQRNAAFAIFVSFTKTKKQITMTRQISYLIIAFIVVLAMNNCSKEESYSLYYTNYTSKERETTWNGWRIKVVSEFTFWYHFESNNFSGDKTFFFSQGDHTESTTVKDIKPGESISIGVTVAANNGNYTVNKISESGDIMHYWIDYPQYSHIIKLWTDDKDVSETVDLPRQITSFESFIIRRGKQLFTGKFQSHTGSDEAMFYVEYAAVDDSGLAAEEKELTGKIQDGDIIFDLQGYHDTKRGDFYLSAGSRNLVYQFVGMYSIGMMYNTQVVTKVSSNFKSNGEEWGAFFESATYSTDVLITGAASATQVNGIPSKWFGRWTDNENFYALTPYQFISPFTPNKPDGFLDVVPVTSTGKWVEQEVKLNDEGISPPIANGTRLNMIWEMWDCQVCNGYDWSLYYHNIMLEEHPQGILLTCWGMGENFEDCKSNIFNPATTEVAFVLLLIRP